MPAKGAIHTRYEDLRHSGRTGPGTHSENYVPEEYRDHVSWSLRQVPKDEYFVLGDHRSSSNDSRSWGFVERKYIYGKAVFVYWPLEKLGRLR